jgi:hypothetical protein
MTSVITFASKRAQDKIRGAVALYALPQVHMGLFRGNVNWEKGC